MPGVDANGAALEELFKSLSAQLICGPIELGDKIVIPIAKMGMGFGTNMSRTGANVKEDGLERHAAGGGVGVFPVAVLIIFKGISGPEGVKIVALSTLGESLSDIAHDIMEKMMSHKKMQEKRTDDMAVIKVE
jgi:uncharacterized spore protein YtfJ